MSNVQSVVRALSILNFSFPIPGRDKANRFSQSVNNQEITEGIRCIACPIMDYTDKTIASFSMSGPLNRLTNSYFEHTLIAKMLETSEAISRECGWPGEKQSQKVIMESNHEQSMLLFVVFL